MFRSDATELASPDHERKVTHLKVNTLFATAMTAAADSRGRSDYLNDRAVAPVLDSSKHFSAIIAERLFCDNIHA